MRYYPTIITLVSVLALGALAHADESNDPATKYRQHSMKAASSHMKAIGDLLRHEIPFRHQLAMHTRAMAEFAEGIPDLFPKDADYFESEASDTIWENWDDFRKRAGETAAAARAVEKAFTDKHMSGASDSYSRLRRSCKGCHDDYRE